MKKAGAQQEQIHGILFNREIGWQEIIYDLINTEQLDPWNINITILTDRYMVKIRELEEDFFVSSKVLLAASLLLRIKSEILLNKYIKSIDEILFGKKEETQKKGLEKIELDEEIPELIPKSPMPRMKKVTLNELMESLNKAITTENRRIKKEIIKKNALRESNISLPKKRKGVKHKLTDIFEKIKIHFKNNKQEKKVHYNKIIGAAKEERVFSFGPLLHLEQQKKIWLEQLKHFGDIHIWEKKTYWKHNGNPYADLLEKSELPKNIQEAKG